MKINKKQIYHLEPPKGLMNDPNGLAYFNNEYYVFFQWNKFEKNHTYKEWGLFKSSDMIEWKFYGTSLKPDKEYDVKGVYSGSGIIIDEKLHLFYTGNNKINNMRKSSQCLAISQDGKFFHKEGIVLSTPSAEYTEHFRDPKVIKIKDKYIMIIGGQKINGFGAIAICISDNGVTWKYKNMLAYTEKYEMIECPDLVKLDKKYILFYCPQKRDNEKDENLLSFSAYKILDFDEQKAEILTEDMKNLDVNQEITDYGFDFYAPQTFLSKDGRIILYAWMSNMNTEEENSFSKDEKHLHCLTLPREVSLKNEQLHQMPIKELYQILSDNTEVINDDKYYKISVEKHACFIKIEEINNNEENINFNNSEIELIFNPFNKIITLTRINWVKSKTESRKIKIDNLETMEIWIDMSSIEIFINNGEKVMSSRIYPNSNKMNIILKNKNFKVICKNIKNKNFIGGDYHE